MAFSPDDQQFLADVGWSLESGQCIGSTRPAADVQLVDEHGVDVWYGRCMGCGVLIRVSHRHHIPLPHVAGGRRAEPD